MVPTDDWIVTNGEGEVVVLELDGGEPISGRIRGPGERALPFRGWLELAGILDRLRAAAPSPTRSDGAAGQ
jgi:hypothetical protein